MVTKNPRHQVKDKKDGHPDTIKEGAVGKSLYNFITVNGVKLKKSQMVGKEDNKKTTPIRKKKKNNNDDEKGNTTPSSSLITKYFVRIKENKDNIKY